MPSLLIECSVYVTVAAIVLTLPGNVTRNISMIYSGRYEDSSRSTAFVMQLAPSEDVLLATAKIGWGGR